LVTLRPDDARAGEAGVLAGVLAWQEGLRDEAVARWTAAASTGERTGHRSDAERAHFWLAKTADDDPTRRAHAEAAIALDPLGDAAARVRDWVAGSGLGQAALAQAFDDADDDSAIVRWLSTWTDGADAAGWMTARETAARRPESVRGAAWLGLGERAQELATWRA